MSIIFDVLLIAVVVVVIILSKNKGFVASCLDTLSLVISAVVSFLFTNKIADFVYHLFVEDLVKTTFKNALDDASNGLTVGEKVSTMVDALPQSALKLAEYFGINIEHLKHNTSMGMFTDEELIEVVTEKVAYDIMILIVQAICFIVLFILVSLLVKFVSSFLSATLSKIPLVGQLDSVLGACFGLVKGCIIVVSISVLLTIIVATAEPNSPLLAIEDSFIYGFLKDLSPINIA